MVQSWVWSGRQPTLTILWSNQGPLVRGLSAHILRAAVKEVPEGGEEDPREEAGRHSPQTTPRPSPLAVPDLAVPLCSESTDCLGVSGEFISAGGVRCFPEALEGFEQGVNSSPDSAKHHLTDLSLLSEKREQSITQNQYYPSIHPFLRLTLPKPVLTDITSEDSIYTV